jgi:hypothetical protein
MRLHEIARASYLFSRVLGQDSPYEEFVASVGRVLDLEQSSHRKSLLIWLNKWGCRNIKVACHDEASNEILEWYEQFRGDLPPIQTHVWETARYADVIRDGFDSLRCRTAATLADRINPIGPTGAAKIFFAICPGALPPWDTAIRNRLGYGESGDSYWRFVQSVTQQLCELREDCNRHGIELSNLAHVLDRAATITLPKLVDEFYWVTITRNATLPDAALVQRWLTWGVE